nr:protein kinase [uncultured Acetatifactor sp.]
MEYEEIRLLKQSDKSTVHLVREKGGSRVLVRKKLAGRHPVYQTLQKNPHPGLPRLYEVAIAEDSTTVIEEYIEGQTSGEAELSGKQFRQVVRELCAVLEFLHGKGIIHRDIKPSNILLTEECHVRLIDFDAARMPREGAEQDTRLLGTRGFAPPEQYGFAQTDERADIYALGVTMEQLLGETVRKPRYRRVIRKCRNLNPDKRYQSMRQVRQAFFPGGGAEGCGLRLR